MGQNSTKTKVQAVTAWGAEKTSSNKSVSAPPAHITEKSNSSNSESSPTVQNTLGSCVTLSEAPGNGRSLTTTAAAATTTTTTTTIAHAKQNKNSKWSILMPPSTYAHTDVPLQLAAEYFTSFPFTIPSDQDADGFKHNRVVALADDTIILLDRNNDKLKLFSPDYKFLHHLRTPTRGPVGVDYANGLTVVDKSTVAVSFGGVYNCVNLYTVKGGKLELTTSAKRRDKSGDLLDIAYQNKSFICLVSHYSEFIRSIELMDTDNHRRVIVKEKGLFSVYTDIIAGNRNCFYVSYTYPHKVRCFSFEGTQLWNIPAPTGAAGLALVLGQLCVVLENGILRSATRNGQVCSDINLRLPFTPHCVCYQQHAKKFLMTYCPLYGRIRVFSLC